MKIIQSARMMLNDNLHDLYHTVEHHYKVYENANLISVSEELKVDHEVLDVACWLHDLFKSKKDEEMNLRNFLRKYTNDVGYIDNVINIINEHSFDKKQTTDESKVLYDADKIELVSIARWKYVFDSYKEGVVTIKERDKYIDEMNRRVPTLEESLNFDTSKRLFAERFELFKSWLTSIGRFKDGKVV